MRPAQLSPSCLDPAAHLPGGTHEDFPWPALTRTRPGAFYTRRAHSVNSAAAIRHARRTVSATFAFAQA